MKRVPLIFTQASEQHVHLGGAERGRDITHADFGRKITNDEYDHVEAEVNALIRKTRRGRVGSPEELDYYQALMHDWEAIHRLPQTFYVDRDARDEKFYRFAVMFGLLPEQSGLGATQAMPYWQLGQTGEDEDEDEDEDEQDPADYLRFERGDCAVLAQRLAQATGLPLVGLFSRDGELHHVAVEVDRQRVLDIAGVSAKRARAAGSAAPTGVWRRINADAIHAGGLTDETNYDDAELEVVDDAVDQILSENTEELDLG